MKQKRSINIYDAISQMRKLSRAGETFSIAFMSCDTSREKSSGMVELVKAKLRAPASDDAFKNSQYMINYLNVETNIPGQFYQILLMYYNGMRITL